MQNSEGKQQRVNWWDQRLWPSSEGSDCAAAPPKPTCFVNTASPSCERPIGFRAPLTALLGGPTIEPHYRTLSSNLTRCARYALVSHDRTRAHRLPPIRAVAVWMSPLPPPWASELLMWTAGLGRSFAPAAWALPPVAPCPRRPVSCDGCGSRPLGKAMAVTRPLQGCYRAITWLLHGCVTTRLCDGCARRLCDTAVAQR